MRQIAPALFLLALAASLPPEIGRYTAERRLRRGTEEFRAALSSGGGADSGLLLLDRAALAGAEISKDLPHDPRPLILAGSSHLLARRTREALDHYRRAFETGERAEIDLNLGRAYGMAGDRKKASGAVLRALWISPTLAASLPKEAANEFAKRIRGLEADLRAGRLQAPPPPPD